MKEKKTFLKPEMQVVQLQHKGMLCGSCDLYGCADGDNPLCNEEFDG